jgi:hypothetical protein
LPPTLARSERLTETPGRQVVAHGRAQRNRAAAGVCVARHLGLDADVEAGEMRVARGGAACGDGPARDEEVAPGRDAVGRARPRDVEIAAERHLVHVGRGGHGRQEKEGQETTAQHGGHLAGIRGPDHPRPVPAPAR